jgi:hypothetical protein
MVWSSMRVEEGARKRRVRNANGGVPHRANSFSMSLGGEPLELLSLETFLVVLEIPEVAVTPTVQTSHQTHLRGVLLKAQSG